MHSEDSAGPWSAEHRLGSDIIPFAVSRPGGAIWWGERTREPR